VSFQSPYYLLALLAVPLVVLTYVIAHRRRSGTAARFGSSPMLPNVVNRSPGWRRHLPPAIMLLALTAMLVGLARPQARVSVPRENATIMLAIDTSRSMAAKDVRPTRLAAAQAAVRDFLAAAPKTYRIGVVAFATDARLVAPPTHDRTLVEQAIAQLRTGQGTALGDAITNAIAASATPASQQAKGEPPPPASILLLSDGRQDGGTISPTQAAQRARARGIPVYTVSLGTQDGIVEVPVTGGYTARVQVPPDPNTLRQVATTTGGRFFAAPTSVDLKAVYADLASRLGRERRWREVTVALAAAGAILMLAGGALSAAWFRRIP
jgi:Ca-activated chloride channel family protein